MSEQYRRLTLADAVEYQRLVHQAYQPVAELGIHFAAANADLSSIQIHLQTNVVYGLFIEQKLAATMSLRLPWGNNPGPYGVPHIGWVATHPEFKQQGLAAKMLVWLEQHILIAQFNLPFVTLGTAENHPWLAQFYQKYGFEAIEKANLTPDHTTIYYRKILNPALFELWQRFNSK